MTAKKSRLAAVALMVLGALWLAPTALSMLSAVRSGASVTVVGVLLNLGPGMFLILTGATLLARPRRSTVAFWASPLWVPIFVWMWARADGGIEYPLAVGLAAGLFAYVAMLVVGLPLFAYLRSRHWDGFGVTAAAAAAAAALLTWLVRALVAFAGDPSDVFALIYSALDPGVFTASAILGALAGATFWVVVRPDRLATSADRLDVFS